MQRPQSGCANETAADRVSDACSHVDRKVLSPIDLAKAVQIKRIGEIFDIDPDAVTTGDVLDKKSALAVSSMVSSLITKRRWDWVLIDEPSNGAGDVGEPCS